MENYTYEKHQIELAGFIFPDTHLSHITAITVCKDTVVYSNYYPCDKSKAIQTDVISVFSFLFFYVGVVRNIKGELLIATGNSPDVILLVKSKKQKQNDYTCKTYTVEHKLENLFSSVIFF